MDGRLRLGSRQQNAFLVVVSTLLVLGALEILARIFWDPGDYRPIIIADRVYGWRLSPGAHMRAVDSDRRLTYRVEVNSLGWRDPERSRTKAAQVKRVLLLGDSFVFGTGVEMGERMGDLIDRGLGDRVEVVNAAVAGWGTDQQYIYLNREGFALHPDVVVLSLSLGTDVANNMLDHNLYGVAPKPRFELMDGELVHLPPGERPKPSRSAKLGRLLQHSRLLHYVGRHVRILRARLRAKPPPTPGIPYYSEDLENEESHWSVYRVDQSSRFERAFQVTEALITAMHDSCAARGIPFVLFAFPQKNEVDVQARQRELAHFGFDDSWFDMEKPYTRIQALAERLECEYVYPLDAFRQQNAATPLFLTRDAHPNPAGHALAAQCLQPAIAAALRLPMQGARH